MTTIVLHRFPLSHFSEKARVLLDWKRVDYAIREYTLGLPQRKIVKLSGQRKVPVIEHDGRVVSDSTRIAHYLDDTFADRPLVPADPVLREEVLGLEDRIDRAFGVGAPLAWGEYALTHRDHLDLLAIEIHGATVPSVRAMGAAVRFARGLGAGRAFIDKKIARVRDLLVELTERLTRGPYLVGTTPTLADLAAVGLVFHLEFPRSKYFPVPELAGHGVPEWTDEFAPFFDWRRKLYADYLT
jgi:glutathione S-transferase